MQRIIDTRTGEVRAEPFNAAERGRRTAEKARLQAEENARQQAERNLDTAPAVVRDVMQALILAGVLTAEQARTAYATAVQARQGA